MQLQASCIDGSTNKNLGALEKSRMGIAYVIFVYTFIKKNL
jgi:hypothetical protein